MNAGSSSRRWHLRELELAILRLIITAIERLRVDGDLAKIGELAKHPAEGWIGGGNLSSFASV